MALPHTFAALSSAQMSFLDDNDQALGALTTLQATASGTNSITLTPAANAPAVSAYGLPSPVRFGFVAAATSSGAVTARVNALAFLKVFLPSGVQANTGDITSGFYYEVVYIASLDSGNGGLQIVSALPGAGTSPASIGSAKGLIVTNNAGTPSTKIDITANKAVMCTSSGLPVFASAVSVTIDLTTAGANGMDTLPRPTSGWVYIYLISNGSVTAGIATTTSPTAGSFSPVPSGYIYSCYVGAMYCDGSQNLMRTLQEGNIAEYKLVAASNTTIPPNISNGTVGTYSATAPTLSAVSITNVVPLTASSIYVTANSQWKGGAAATLLVAPSTTWGGANNGPQGSNGVTYPIAIVATGTQMPNLAAWISLEATTIAFASSAAGGAVSCLGWRDYYVNA